MIIISQDEEEIVNFDKVESIWICSDEEGRFTIEATADANSTLGYYETKERAKGVLQEIIEEYKKCNSSWSGSGFVANKVFYMPKE